MGDRVFFSLPLSLINIYQMNITSAGSISMNSTFNLSQLIGLHVYTNKYLARKYKENRVGEKRREKLLTCSLSLFHCVLVELPGLFLIYHRDVRLFFQND
jgi:hypothetical protein